MIISDERLAQAIMEYDDALMASLPDPKDCVHEFSEAFEKKMKKLIRRADHYVAYKALRYAASILIAFLLSASMLLTFNAEARAAVVNWIKEYAHGVYNYFFTAEEMESSADYVLGWLPDGYQLAESFEYPTGKTYIYFNDENIMLTFYYQRGSDLNSFTTADNSYEETHIVSEDFQADLYLSTEKNKANTIAWISENEDIIFTVSGYESEEVLIKIAKSVVPE